jgi:ABC-type lipoprotein export system ATPase subunit
MDRHEARVQGVRPIGTSAMTAAIDARGLIAVRSAGGASVAALRGLDLRVAAGEIVAVVGPSGSGKTTLLRLLGGAERPTAGTVVVNGLALERADAAAIRHHRRDVVAGVDQHYRRALSPYLPAREIVALPLALRGVGGRERGERAAELLRALGLGDRGDARLRELSGGEQQRVAVAAALAIRPAVLLADEPTGELDAASTSELLALLREVIRAEGATAVIVTHDPAVEAIADRVVVLEDGRAVAVRDGPVGTRERPLTDASGWHAPEVTWRQTPIAGAHGPANPRVEPSHGRRVDLAGPAGPAIRLRDVTRRYGPAGHPLTALLDLSADVRSGGVHALTGPSGSGKSTLLRLVAGLDRPDGGLVEVLGTDLGTLGRDGLAAFRAAHVGVAEQARGLVPFLDVHENLALAASIHAAPDQGEVAAEDLAELLERLGLGAVAQRRPAELSAGERTRAAIGRALVTGPELLLLDEPTATLDRVNAARVGALLASLGRDRTILVATHDPALMSVADDRIDLTRHPVSAPG